MNKRIAFVKQTASQFEDEKNFVDLWLGAALSNTEHSHSVRYARDVLELLSKHSVLFRK